MRAAFMLLALAASCLRAEICDVLESAEIGALFARTRESAVVHEQPAYAVVFRVQHGAGAADKHDGADEVWVVRRGAATISLGDRQHQAGAGDVLNVPRGTAYRIDAGQSRFEYLAVRVFPLGTRQPPAFGGLLAPRRMPDIVKKAEIDATFAAHDKNQPLHSARNLTVNYVIYKGRGGPWEAHRGCTDIYFVHSGTAVAELGGEIAGAREESPGEIRGTGVSGARRHRIGPGDIVLIPPETAHHMIPDGGKLGYLLVKVWAE